GPPDSFRGQLECPRQNQRSWKPKNDCTDKNLHHPGRRFESREQNGSCLNQQPRHDRVGDGDPVNLASLQLGKKGSRVHANAGKVTATRFPYTNRKYPLRCRPPACGLMNRSMPLSVAANESALLATPKSCEGAVPFSHLRGHPGENLDRRGTIHYVFFKREHPHRLLRQI